MDNKYNYITKGKITYIYFINKKGEKFEVLIDTEDLERVINYKYKWNIRKVRKDIWYLASTVYLGSIEGIPKYTTTELHRFILNIENDPFAFIDHENHNGLDNRKENLRITDNDKNTKHRKSKNSNNKSGYRNVSYDKDKNKYIVQLQINGKRHLLGEFEDVHEAGEFAEEMRNTYYKEYQGLS